jgi:hypothetical protein
MRRAWTPEEDKLVRQMRAARSTLADCAAAVGRTEAAVYHRLRKLGLPGGDWKREPWTQDDDETVRINFPMWPAFLIGYLVGKSVSAVHARARKLGVEKSPDFWKNPMAHLWDSTQHPNSIAARFKPGTTPPNKGLRRPGYAPGRMAETQFKKGRPAHEAANYVPIGTEKVDTKRGVLVRKITDDPTIYPAGRWRPVHVMVWEAVHGPVPEGHIVIFRRGMKTFNAEEITADRLELVSLAENMRRNSIHTYPAPIKRAMQTRGVLNRRINKLAKTRNKA